MKNAKLMLTLLLFASSFLFSCTPDRMSPSTTKEIIIQGNWGVNYFYNGQDNTAQFRGFTFSFNGNGGVTASNATGSVTGTWRTIQDASRKEVLIISLNTQPLSGLDAQWIVGSANTTTIGLNSSNTQLVLEQK